MIASGTFVRLKGNPACAGILLEGDKFVAGARMVQVRLADGQVKWLPYCCARTRPLRTRKPHGSLRNRQVC